MKRCIQLAKNGLGTTYPNPLVGSVLVHNNTIIGEGWHYQAGQPHAEVNAVNSVKEISLLSEATIYVSLEPCSHFGKTPPCADLIIQKGIKKVVIGTTDPNPKVAGQGIKKLMEAGCDVIVGVLEKECNELNKRFFTFQQKKRPYIILKWAQTTDSFIAPKTRDAQKPVWITNEFSRQLAHKLRAEEQAILVGTNTVRDDNPSLTTRDWFGNNPLRVILDRNNNLDKSLSVYNKEAATLILTEKPTEAFGTTSFESLDFDNNLASNICEVLYKKNIQSLIVEGGAQTLQTFIDANLWDEVLVFEGKTTFTKGIKAPVFSGNLLKQSEIAEDILLHYKNPSI
ncbi:bifunctional diaminohydroxyphosphoribosylaminopyrimidine deaminase/5-amino-6-(5-phosphoribosylamino)uracil reductase RibD [Rasiella sp. SM2506]|uniref:bifunctional diaminohydroxyphosphoribosylaminopyrimidine deaminase/5-amino-6-(5-phosphoribosylamino)uracil reductase RibD n=1 Tax=Rasiella sp. SM2506 TaxID=3423914 RepID=UPI003D7B7B5F